MICRGRFFERVPCLHVRISLANLGGLVSCADEDAGFVGDNYLVICLENS